MKSIRSIPFVFIILILLVVTTGLRPLTSEASISVNTFADEYNSGAACSLREAIQAANSNAAFGGCPAGNGADTILLPAGTYHLTIDGVNDDTNASGDLDITTDALTVSGQGAGATIDAGSIDRVMDILAGATVTLENITISGGRAPDGNGDEPDGGGLRSFGSLTLIGVTVSDNQAGRGAGGTSNAASGGSGGGIYSDGPSLTISDSIISGNTAGAGEDGKPLGFGGGGGVSPRMVAPIRSRIQSSVITRPVQAVHQRQAPPAAAAAGCICAALPPSPAAPSVATQPDPARPAMEAREGVSLPTAPRPSSTAPSAATPAAAVQLEVALRVTAVALLPAIPC